MIIGSVDHGLHVMQLSELNLHPICMWLINFILQSLPPLLWALLHTAKTSSLLYQFGYQLALALFGAEVLHIAYEPKQFALIVILQWLLAD